MVSVYLISDMALSLGQGVGALLQVLLRFLRVTAIFRSKVPDA